MNAFMHIHYSEEEARRSAEEFKTVLQTGGFNLRNFLRSKTTKLENLVQKHKTEMKTHRIHGQSWDPETDKFMFAKTKTKLQYTGRQLTQRKVLSISASLFDPVGLILPLAIKISGFSES